MISEDELQALTDYIITLEQQVDMLAKERLLYTEGPEALRKVSTQGLVGEIPAGCAIGAAGQIVAVKTAQAQAAIEYHWPIPAELRKPKRRSKKPDGGDGL